MRLFPALVLAPFLLPAADQCEASPEIRQELKRFDNRDVAPGKREEFTRKLADELAAKYPGDFFILTRQERAYHYGKPADRTASIERSCVAIRLQELRGWASPFGLQPGFGPACAPTEHLIRATPL